MSPKQTCFWAWWKRHTPLVRRSTMDRVTKERDRSLAAQASIENALRRAQISFLLDQQWNEIWNF